MPILLFYILGGIKGSVKIKTAGFLGKMGLVFGIMLLGKLLYGIGIIVEAAGENQVDF